MQTFDNIPKLSRKSRTTSLLLATLLCVSAPLHAGPVSGPLSAALALVRGAVTLPFYVAGKAIDGMAKKNENSVVKQTLKTDPNK